MITGNQSKAARALLGWSIRRLADEAALGVKTLEAFEEGLEPLVIVHKVVLREVLERAGVRVVEGKPVTLKMRRSTIKRPHAV